MSTTAFPKGFSDGSAFTQNGWNLSTRTAAPERRSVQLFCTGIVGIYLSKTYLETKHRPIYLLKETSEETVKMHSVQPVKKQESAAKRRKDAHTAEKKNVYFPEYADKRHASERGEIRA